MTSYLCHCGTGSHRQHVNERASFAPIKLYLQKQTAGQIWSAAVVSRILHVCRRTGAQAGRDAQKCFLEEEVAAERSKENSWQWLAPKFVSDSVHGSRCWLCLLEAPPPQHRDPII